MFLSPVDGIPVTLKRLRAATQPFSPLPARFTGHPLQEMPGDDDLADILDRLAGGQPAAVSSQQHWEQFCQFLSHRASNSTANLAEPRIATASAAHEESGGFAAASPQNVPARTSVKCEQQQASETGLSLQQGDRAKLKRRRCREWWPRLAEPDACTLRQESSANAAANESGTIDPQGDQVMKVDPPPVHYQQSS